MGPSKRFCNRKRNPGVSHFYYVLSSQVDCVYHPESFSPLPYCICRYARVRLACTRIFRLTFSRLVQLCVGKMPFCTLIQDGCTGIISLAKGLSSYITCKRCLMVYSLTFFNLAVYPSQVIFVPAGNGQGNNLGNFVAVSLFDYLNDFGKQRGSGFDNQEAFLG